MQGSNREEGRAREVAPTGVRVLDNLVDPSMARVEENSHSGYASSSQPKGPEADALGSYFDLPPKL